MTSDPFERIKKMTGMDQIAEILTDRIAGADFNTLLLQVYREKTRRLTPSELLKRYQDNRFVHPADLDPVRLKQLELDILKIAMRHRSTPIQLSPAAPLGTCSVVATVDQNKVLSAVRGTEIVSDATNLLALHICDLIKSRKMSNRDNLIRFCTTHRHARAQNFGNAPGMLSHFHLFCMVTSGRDTGSYHFEKQTLWEHVGVLQEIFQTLFQSDIQVVLSGRGGYSDSDRLLEQVVQYGERFAIPISRKEPIPENQYYKGLQFTVITKNNGVERQIGDGGFVDWTQQILGNKKERLIISAIGLDRLL